MMGTPTRDEGTLSQALAACRPSAHAQTLVDALCTAPSGQTVAHERGRTRFIFHFSHVLPFLA